MKVVTTVTLHHREKPEDEVKILEPGEHDLPDKVAKSLIRRGHAKHAEAAKAEAAAKEKAQAGSVQVEQVGKGTTAK